jgi:hypothetical protein
MAKRKAPDRAKGQAIRQYLAEHKKAKAPEVIEEMAKLGFQVTQSDIYNIKSYDRRRKGRRGRPKKAQAAVAAAAPSNGNGELTKAQHIRNAFKSLGRKTAPRAIQSHLAGQGVKVSYSQVIAVRNKMRERRALRRAARGPGRPAAARSATAGASSQVSMNDLLAAKAFVDEIGSLSQAHELLNALGQLR